MRKEKKKAPKNKTGRKPKLDPVRSMNLLALLQQGHVIEIACKAVGIGASTFYRWMQTGEKAKGGPYREFWEKVTASRSIAEVTLLDTLQKSARTDWRAAAWLLERLFGDRYADKTKFLVSGQIKHGHEHQHTHETKQIVVIMPEAIAEPRPQPKQIGDKPPTPPAQ